MVGDIVEVKSGDRLPADIRIVKSAGFKVLVELARKVTYEKDDTCKQVNHSCVDCEACVYATSITWKSFLWV